METNYLCPHCKGKLDINNEIILIGIKDDKKGFVLLHTQLGNYQSKLDCSLNIQKGDSVEFICPLCHSSLDCEKGEKRLTCLILVNAANKESKVLFSKVFGESATYHIENKEVLSYGEHAKQYMNPDWFLEE